MTTIATTRPRRAASPLAVAARFAPLIFLLALMALFATLAPRFLLPFNLFNIMRQVSIYGIVAVGMTFVILARGIDLSVGSLIALAGLVAAVVAKGGLPDRLALPFGDGGFAWPLAALAAMLVGAFAGLIQGITIAWLRVPAFVVTLGGLSVFRGFALMIGDGGPVSGFSEAFGSLGQGMIGPVPVPVILFLTIALLGYLVLQHTQWGRAIYAVGSNPEAARLCGMPVERILVGVYTLTGLCSGFGGFLLASRLNSAEAVAGTGYELNIIAAVVIGGTSLFGGSGGIPGTLIGTILIGVLLNGLVILNVSPYLQQVIVGLIIVLAVAFDTFVKRRRR